MKEKPSKSPSPASASVRNSSRSIQAYSNAVQSANITCVGLQAHESALKGGEIIRLPEFTWMT
jgi:hypothetical protein